MCTYASFFPPYFSCPFCRFSIFVFFCRFLLISLLLHENEGVHCLCCRALELRHLFLRFSGHSIKEIGKLLKKSEGYISEQVVKSNDFRRQTKEWMAVVF